MPEIARSVILEEDREWFYADREKRLGKLRGRKNGNGKMDEADWCVGMSLDEMEKTKGGDQAWEVARPGFEKIRGIMGKYKKVGRRSLHVSRLFFDD